MRTNLAARSNLVTHEGAPAKPINAEAQLRRSVMSCLLFEKEFYEDGQDIASRIEQLVGAVRPDVAAAIAVEARKTHNLRHAPLFVARALAKVAKGPVVAETIASVVDRADELSEFMALYWRDGRQPVSHAVRKGLARALVKFDEYQLAKYDRDGIVKLRDVLRIVRPKPADDAQAALWKRVVGRELAAPDTWEVALSGGADKKETFERLIREGNLGYLALLRNLRNMVDAGCDLGLVRDAIVARKNGAHRVLPFRFVAAARAAPQLEPAIDLALCETIAEAPRLLGMTAVLVDVSGSMDVKLSARSDMTRMDAAAALSSVINGDLRVFTFSTSVVEVPPRRGMAGVDAVLRSQHHGGTYLGAAVDAINRQVKHDRLIVITDEQSHDRVPDPAAKRAYMINVASTKNGVGYGRWIHIDGFSESVLRFVGEYERDRAD